MGEFLNLDEDGSPSRITDKFLNLNRVILSWITDKVLNLDKIVLRRITDEFLNLSRVVSVELRASS